MSDASPAPSPEQDDFIAILSAVMETERGRWFLAEFARRNRHAETERVLGAIARLEAVLVPAPLAATPPGRPEPAMVQPVPPSPDANPPMSAIDALSVDARLRMFR